jgi:hypothetical protein
MLDGCIKDNQDIQLEQFPRLRPLVQGLSRSRRHNLAVVNELRLLARSSRLCRAIKGKVEG